MRFCVGVGKGVGGGGGGDVEVVGVGRVHEVGESGAGLLEGGSGGVGGEDSCGEAEEEERVWRVHLGVAFVWGEEGWGGGDWLSEIWGLLIALVYSLYILHMYIIFIIYLM